MSGWEDGDEIDYLNREVQRLTNALAFYADAENWTSPSKGFALQYDPVISAAFVDRGEKARKALEGEE